MSGASKWVVPAIAAVVLLVLPTSMLGIAILAVSGSLGSAFGGCHGDGGPGGGGQQIGDRQWSGEQMTNAQTITSTVQQRHLPKRAAVIAISTAIVESQLKNVHYGDRDSLGLFQQRPSQGWGSPEQITNPAYATGTFLDHLVALGDWYSMPPGAAQQRVQASAAPGRYAPQEQPASDLLGRFWSGPDNPLPPPTGATPAQQASLSTGAGCADQGGSNLPVDPQKLPPDYQPPTDPRQRAAVDFALAQLGKPYVWGAKGPDSFDCSGLVQAAWAHAGVPISAGTTSQKNDGRAIGSPAELQPGDLVFIAGSFGSPNNPRHVGLYAGHGLIVNAYDTKTGVILERLEKWTPQIVAIRRVAEPTTPTPPPAPTQQGSAQA